MLDSLLTPWRLKWYSNIILFGIFSGIVIVLFTGTGPSIISGRLGGDFASFYAAGRMVAREGFTNLYDLDRQIESQRDLYPDQTGVLPFSYPPYVALACFPLSFFSYRVAFTIHLFINIAALFTAFIYLKKINPGLGKWYLPSFVLALTFYPFSKAVLNGQVTAIIFLLFTLIWFHENSGKPYFAGLFMALLIFKPQFLIPAIGLFLLSGRIKTFISAILFSGLVVLITFPFTGGKSYIDWYRFTKWFIPADAIVNGRNAVSWIGFFENIFNQYNKNINVIGYILCIITILIISYIWMAGSNKSDFGAQMGIAVASFVLIPPHVMFYDASLIALTYFRLLNVFHQKILPVFIVWIFGFTQIFAEKLGFSPVFFLVVCTFLLSLKHLTPHACKNIQC